MSELLACHLQIDLAFHFWKKIKYAKNHINATTMEQNVAWSLNCDENYHNVTSMGMYKVKFILYLIIMWSGTKSRS